MAPQIPVLNAVPESDHIDIRQNRTPNAQQERVPIHHVTVGQFAQGQCDEGM